MVPRPSCWAFSFLVDYKHMLPVRLCHAGQEQTVEGRLSISVKGRVRGREMQSWAFLHEVLFVSLVKSLKTLRAGSLDLLHGPGI